MGQWSFSHFELENQLIRQQKTDQPGIITITPITQLWVGDTEKLSLAFTHGWLALDEWINSADSSDYNNPIQNRKNSIHWRIQGGASDVPPLSTISFIFMQLKKLAK